MKSQNTHEQIKSAITTGSAILVTGAGFSCSAKNQKNRNLPVGKQLSQLLWPIAFGDDGYEEDSLLSDVYRAAKLESFITTKRILSEAFTVDASSVPDRYKTWFALPWYKMYTLNIDNLDTFINRHTSLPRQLQILNGLTSRPGDIDNRSLVSIHLNGTLKDYPKITFDASDYARRTANFDPWYEQFESEVASHPVIYIGTVLQEPFFWHYLELRGRRGGGAELRPLSWIVSPEMGRSKRATLENLNIRWIEDTEETFFNKYINPWRSEYLEISKSLSQDDSSHNEKMLQDVRAIVETNERGSADFLMGAEPTWGDILDGYSASMDWEEICLKYITRKNLPLIIHGDVGCGRTTSLMRMGARLVAEGFEVEWLKKDTASPMNSIRAAVKNSTADFIFVDDLDRFGAAGIDLISDRSGKKHANIVAALRKSRFHQLGYSELSSSIQEFEVPRLSHSDAISLVDALDKANRLGALVSVNPAQRPQQLMRRAGRQLLVAMVEATSGQKFREKIAEECYELPDLQKQIYGILCLAFSTEKQRLSLDDIILALNLEANEIMEQIFIMAQAGVVVENKRQYFPRHRVIAQTAVDYYRSNQQLSDIIAKFVHMLAIKYRPNAVTSDKYGKLLIRFLSHDFLSEQLQNPKSVRFVYSKSEKALRKEFHYWLQRGMFELNCANFENARNFLMQARSLRPDDIMANTAWAQLLLALSCSRPEEGSASTDFYKGEKLLGAILDDRPPYSPHSFHVYIVHVCQWLRKSSDDWDTKADLVDRLIYRTHLGLYLYPRNNRITHAAKDVDRLAKLYRRPAL